MKTTLPLIAALALVGTGASASAQSSSLYVNAEPAAALAPAAPTAGAGVPTNRPSAEVTRASLMAVRAPEPRRFSVQDLVTVIIRESTEAESDSKLETKKDAKLSGEISAIPDLALLNAFAKVGFGTKLTDDPKVGMSFNKDFKGDGGYSRSDTLTTRVQARIIDIKPNGTLVLEARKYLRNDGESLSVILTGTCRKDDVTADNTILSTQLYDLHVDKQTTGELRRAAKKGWITKLFEGVFGF